MFDITSSTKIGVLMGGLSPEKDISKKSGQAVARGLRQKGYSVTEIIVDENIATNLLQNEIEVAWLALHGEFGEDGCIQGMLEIMGIPYTGSGVSACAISMNKTSTKRAVQMLDVVMPKDCIWDSRTPFPDWKAPLVIKDPMGGSSIGVWVCMTEAELMAAIADCTAHPTQYLIEEYVGGIEITVAVLQNQALPVITILPKGEFFDLTCKYTKGQTTYLAPNEGEIISKESGIPENIAKDAQEQASKIFQALGMQGVARADFIVPCTGKHPNHQIIETARPTFLEINAIPGMTETSLTPMAAKVIGIDFADLTEKILLSAHRKPHPH